MTLIGDTLYVANTDALVSVPYEVGQTSFQAMPRVVAPLPGQRVDTRVKPERPDLVAKAVVPDYALGPHTASLGLAFSMNSSLPAPYAAGAFIGQHGSRNRRPRSGYKVVFVPFVPLTPPARARRMGPQRRSA